MSEILGLQALTVGEPEPDGAGYQWSATSVVCDPQTLAADAGE